MLRTLTINPIRPPTPTSHTWIVFSQLWNRVAKSYLYGLLISRKNPTLFQWNFVSKFPLLEEAIPSFEILRYDHASACLTSIIVDVPFVVKCDASEHILAATYNQEGQSVTFHSLIISKSKAYYSNAEKKAAAIIDAKRKGSHYLLTDRKAASFTLCFSWLSKAKTLSFKCAEPSWEALTTTLSMYQGKTIWLQMLFLEFVTWLIMLQI